MNFFKLFFVSASDASYWVQFKVAFNHAMFDGNRIHSLLQPHFTICACAVGIIKHLNFKLVAKFTT